MKFLYRPVKPFVVNQLFGENKACVSLDGKNTYITCDGLNPPEGFKSIYGKRGHLGIDLRAYHGQEVYASRDGVVTYIDTSEKSGLDVRIETEIKGEKYIHIYEHLMRYDVKIGDKVMTGQLIGLADNTGWSSGDHLHFEVHKLEKGKWVPIDPMPIMDDVFAIDVLAISNKVAYISELVAELSDRLARWLRERSR